MKKIVLLLQLFCLYAAATPLSLQLYEAPEHAISANDFEVLVEGRKCFVYNTRPAAFTYFSFSGPVELRITCPGTIYEYDVRPKSSQVQVNVYRNQLHIILTKPANLSIEINRNIKRPLFVFANGPETAMPDKTSSDVIFFEKGKIHTPGLVMLRSNQTVYIEGGAIVKGSFIASGKNISIRGRGILDNSHYTKGEARPIALNQCENVLLEGFIIAESKHWTCGAYASKNITYRNIKIVSDNDWDDGIDIVGSQQVLVDSCFIRTKDDCIAVKAGIDYFDPFPSSGMVDQITVQNCVLWNGVWGNGLEIGFETRTDTIQNIRFRNCDIIHTEGPEGTFTIHNGDRAYIKNISYEDIRVEDARGYLIDFKILHSQYSKDKKRGFIDGVTLKNITVEGDVFPTSLIMGFDERHKISNITLENVRIHGKKILSLYDGMIGIIHASGIIYK